MSNTALSGWACCAGYNLLLNPSGMITQHERVQTLLPLNCRRWRIERKSLIIYQFIKVNLSAVKIQYVIKRVCNVGLSLLRFEKKRKKKETASKQGPAA